MPTQQQLFTAAQIKGLLRDTDPDMGRIQNKWLDIIGNVSSFWLKELMEKVAVTAPSKDEDDQAESTETLERIYRVIRENEDTYGFLRPVLNTFEVQEKAVSSAGLISHSSRRRKRATAATKSTISSSNHPEASKKLKSTKPSALKRRAKLHGEEREKVDEALDLFGRSADAFMEQEEPKSIIYDEEDYD